MPKKFWKWAFEERSKLLDQMKNGTIGEGPQMFLGFTRHTPTMITVGQSGLNGSIKGFGFVPTLEHIEYVTKKFIESINGPEQGYSERGLNLLTELMYSSEASIKIDKTRLISLELAFGHTYMNVKDKKSDCTLVYYQPPVTSYEVRGKVTLYENGLYMEFANAMHDVFHKQNGLRKLNPVYVFEIERVFDNSVPAFGIELNE